MMKYIGTIAHKDEYDIARTMEVECHVNMKAVIFKIYKRSPERHLYVELFKTEDDQWLDLIEGSTTDSVEIGKKISYLIEGGEIGWLKE